MSTVLEHSPSRPFTGRVLHATAHLAFTVGRYIVDVAIEQERREPGSVGVVVSNDAEEGWKSSPDLLAELARHHIPVFQCGDFFKRDAAGLRAAASQLKELGVGGNPSLVVHAHTAMAALVARWAGASTVVASFHGWNQNRPSHIDLQDAMAFTMADRVVAVSDFWKDVLQAKTSLTDVVVIPYAMDLGRLSPVRHAHRDSTSPRLLFAGDITDRMGVDLILNAMAILWADVPQAELHLFGDGPARQKNEALAKTLDRSGGRVIFHGAVADTYSRLNEFDVFVRANRSDDQPMPIIEAMLTGLPIVGTPVGSLPGWVMAGRSGLVVPKDAPRRFAAAVRVLLTTSRSGREELGVAGQAFARMAFDVRRHAEELDGLYGSAFRKERPRSSHEPIVNMTTVDGAIRLHLGCGTDKREGWVNVDGRSVVEPDVVAPVDSLPMFENGSVDAIEACHLLEHLPVHEAKRAFGEWHRLLKAGGTLHLELPNLDACVRMLGQHTDSNGHDLGMMGIFGWPDGVENDGVAQVHKWGWTPRSLSDALGEAGFVDVRQEPITQTWRPAAKVDRDFRVRAIKPEQSRA